VLARTDGKDKERKDKPSQIADGKKGKNIA
jgi:hypothetical protein